MHAMASYRLILFATVYLLFVKHSTTDENCNGRVETDNVRANTNRPIAEEMAKPMIVSTNSGQIQGTFNTTLLHNRLYYSFLGIPYAEPPIGELRFKAPVKIKPWEHTLDASEYGPPCAQPDVTLNKFSGSEDCLTLNIFVPATGMLFKDDGLLPVVFYIHGGAFMFGSSRQMGPDLLVNEDIVLVTVNFRLGPFGFMSLGTPEYSGNMALKDQLLALKWVKENIQLFGGNPKRITVYGHSSGGVMAHMHTLSPASCGLFKRAIISGATALNPWAIGTHNHADYVRELCMKFQKTDIGRTSISDAMRWLKEFDYHTFGLTTVAPFYNGTWANRTISIYWGPTIEVQNAVEPFFDRTVYDYLQGSTQMDVLFSFTSAESMMIAGVELNNPEHLKAFDYNFKIQLPLVGLHYNYDTNAYSMYAHEIRKHYFGDRAVDENTIREYVRLTSDAFFIYAMDRTVRSQARRSSGNTYYFQFSASTDLSFFRKFANGSDLGIYGSAHIEDMCHIFRLREWEPEIEDEIYNVLELNSTAGAVSKRLIKMITNFVSWGDPAPKHDPMYFPRVQANDESDDDVLINFFNVTNSGFAVGNNPYGESIRFWNNFFRQHWSELQTTPLPDTLFKN